MRNRCLRSAPGVQSPRAFPLRSRRRSKPATSGAGRLDPPATVSGTTAAHPAATEAIVTPSLARTSSFWLQPVDAAPVPGTVPFDSGVHHAGMAVQPPPVTTAPSSTAPALSPSAPFPTPSWVDDDFAVERALLADELPPGFDASRFIAEAGTFEQFGLAEELAAGRLPIQTIDGLIDGYRATDEGAATRCTSSISAP